MEQRIEGFFDFLKFIFKSSNKLDYFQYDGDFNNGDYVPSLLSYENTDEDFLNEKLKENKNRFIIYNWIDEEGNFNPPKYERNKYGFRTKIEYKSNIPIALGCSNTFGKGNHTEHTWPFLLSKKIEEPIINLGVTGGSMDTIYRILKKYLENYIPNKVFLSIPGPFRNEYLISHPIDKHIQFGANFHVHSDTKLKIISQLQKDVFDYITSVEENTFLNFHKNLDAIKYLCSINKIELVYIYDPCFWDEEYMRKIQLFIDIHHSFEKLHFGPELQEVICNLFTEKIKK